MQRNFKYLDDLIHSGTKTVVLDSDIVLDDCEVDQYMEGISLDIDGLVIDGNGHSIDARCKSRIFKVSGLGALVTDLTFKNGCRFRGGAICNECFGLTVRNSTFLSNFSQNDGGAIFNAAKLILCDCSFIENRSNSKGGAIFNGGKVHIERNEFESNSSLLEGGAIYNMKVSHIWDCVFKANVSAEIGGAIFSEKIEIKSMRAPYRGVVEICSLYNFDCEFEENLPDDVFEVPGEK